MMMYNQKHHRVIQPWATIVYWKNGSAAFVEDNDWTDVSVYPTGNEYSGEQYTSEEEYHIQRYVTALYHAFQNGEKHAQKKIKESLGIYK
jgi:hypothetical protein